MAGSPSGLLVAHDTASPALSAAAHLKRIRRWWCTSCISPSEISSMILAGDPCG